MSGGGYRAMVFHLGVLWRLYDAGLISRLDRVTSVSGGSITAGVLALAWDSLSFEREAVRDDFASLVVAPVRRLASKTIDAGSVIRGALLPGTISDRIEAAYDKYVFGGATLQDLPDRPRFIINATNVQSGALWRFSKPYMRDYRVGEVKRPTVSLAKAVAASSAFPPVLSPCKLDVDPDDFTPSSGDDLQHEPYTDTVVLTDGGVYDNLGLETAWKRCKTILVSDAGGAFSAEPEPKEDWARHAIRVLGLVDNQVRSLRRRDLIAAYKRGDRKGAYWGIRTDIEDYGLADSIPFPHEESLKLAGLATRLKRLPRESQESLINWGYAVCDAALRAHVVPELAPPPGLPYGRQVAP